MTTVPGTYFTQEQLEAARKVDNVSDEGRAGSNKLTHFGFVYHMKKKQYDKALAWYILAARENNSYAQNNIGELYYNGEGVPKNYLCALEWFLKSAEQNKYKETPNFIGKLFENGYDISLNKYKTLEWYCHGRDYANINTLKGQGYHRSATDKKKGRPQLIKETEAILDAENKKLEQKQHKTQQEMEALVDLNTTYILTGDGQNTWKDVSILSAHDKQRYTKPVNSFVTDNGNEIRELKKQMQLLRQDKNTFENQAKQIQSLKQEKANLELQMKEKDKELVSLRNDRQSLQRGNSIVQRQITRNDSKITSLQSKNQELKLKINSLEYQVKEKDRKTILVQTEYQSLKQEKAANEYQLKEIVNKMSLLENENRTYRTSSLTQIQKLETLNYEKATFEKIKMQTSIEMERLKASNIALIQSKQDSGSEIERLKSSNAKLEQLLKSKEDATVPLNGEIKNLFTVNQLITDMVETQKSLLKSKTNEMELLKQNMSIC